MWHVFLGVLIAYGQTNTNMEIDEIRQQWQLPALAGASLEDGNYREYVTGVRMLNSPGAAKEGDLFHLGSNTKAMTAVLIAQLVESGKLNWSTSLQEIFSERITGQSPWAAVTIEDLLSHTSGVPGNDLQFNNGATWSQLLSLELSPEQGRAIVLSDVLQSTPIAAPATQYTYSNFNYIILGAVIDRLSNKTWEVTIREKLFIPLQMLSCGFGAPDSSNTTSLEPPQPVPHIRLDKDTVIADRGFDNPPTYNSSGRVHCSLRDWSQFIQFQMDGYNKKKTPLLKAETFVKLFTKNPVNDYTYGALWRSTRPWASGPVFSHNGANTRSYSVTWWSPVDNRAFMSTTNQGDTNNQISFEATDQVISVLRKNK